MRRRSSPNAFTLVELLVVIGIIAVLISILLPSLNKARESANSAACLSNLRQMATAALMFAGERKGQLPPASDKRWAMMNDPSQTKFIYRANPTVGGTNDLLDWASHLLPYMGGKNLAGSDFNSAPAAQSRVFICPSDFIASQWEGPSSPGFTVFNNVVGASQRISYAINGDITANVDIVNLPARGKFGLSDNMLVYQADGQGNAVQLPEQSLPLNGKLNRVRNSSQTMLFADGGTVPPLGGQAPLDDPKVLVYTTNYIAFSSDQFGLIASKGHQIRYTLAGVASTPWLNKRIPLDRHGARSSSIRANNNNPRLAELRRGKLNVAFCDGRAETVNFDDFGKVNVSPYAPR